jgi:hypothetical protein
MFRKAVFAYTFVIAGLVAAWLFLTLHVSEGDRQRFKVLQQKGHAIAAASNARSTQQSRAGVRKDLWITEEGGARLHDRIESASSTLTLTPVGDHMDIIEHLNQIRCSMQDKIVYQNQKWVQHVRYFEADTGIYQYSTNQFSAQTVSLALFRLPGRELPAALTQSAPYLKGIAQDVSFAAGGKASQFQAKRFKASFVGQKND